MKRSLSLLLTLVMVLSLFACGQKNAAPTWQEQYDLGIRYLSEGNYEEAIIAFTAAIEIDPKRAEAYVGRGDAYLALGNEEAAAENYTLAAEYGDETAQEKLDALLEPPADSEDEDSASGEMEQPYWGGWSFDVPGDDGIPWKASTMLGSDGVCRTLWSAEGGEGAGEADYYIVETLAELPDDLIAALFENQNPTLFFVYDNERDVLYTSFDAGEYIFFSRSGSGHQGGFYDPDSDTLIFAEDIVIPEQTDASEEWKALLCQNSWYALDPLPDGSTWISFYEFSADGSFSYEGGWYQSEMASWENGTYAISEDGVLTMDYAGTINEQYRYQLSGDNSAVVFTQMSENGLFYFHTPGVTQTLMPE